MFAQKLVNRGEEKNYMYFAERNNVSSVKECAKACWGAKFCKSATYLPKNKVCRLGYAQVARCSDKELVEDCSPTDALSVLCITCAAGGHETVMEDATSPKTTEKLTTAVVYADLQVVDSCFKAHPYKVLINAAMDVFQGHSIKECLCFCAQTWNAKSAGILQSKRCGSVLYNSALRECVLNTASVKVDSRSLISSRNMTEIVYEFVCAERPRQAEDYTQTLCRNSDYSTAQRPPCLEKLAGYVLNNAAAALIHGVSEDECRCHCYQSKGRDNYGFDCKSAMYYANERDCVLNIKDRFLQPNLLSFVGNFSVVSYLGLTCSGSKMVSIMEEKCTTRRIIHQPAEIRNAIKGLKDKDKDGKSKEGKKIVSTTPGEHTDQCFVEQPHHVLSGLTAAVESQKTVDECKCLCAESMALYDFACMSSQYDWNTKVCLLNNANRILNPKRFYEVTIPEVTVSYFDFICTEDKARAYISTKCKKLRYSSNNQFRNPKLVLPEDLNEKEGLYLNEHVKADGPKKSENPVHLKQKLSGNRIDDGIIISGQDKKSLIISPDGVEIKPEKSLKKLLVQTEDFVKKIEETSRTEEVNTDPATIRTMTTTMRPAATTEISTTTTTTTPSPSTTKASTTQDMTVTTTPTQTTGATTETTTIDEYAEVSCSFSTLYDAEFRGKLIVPPFTVKSYAACLAECAKLKCRSANLSAFLGKFEQCYLFSDSAIDYRFESPLTYRKGIAYYEGISCVKHGVPL